MIIFIKKKNYIKKDNNYINPFPIYSTGTDPNLIYNIYRFLKNGLINNKRTWPDYIQDIKDKKRDIKKLEFYTKIGNVGEGQGMTKLKSKSKTKIKNFEVENNDLYNNRIINDLYQRKKL